MPASFAEKNTIRCLIATAAALVAFTLPIASSAQTTFDGAPAFEVYSHSSTRTETHSGTFAHTSSVMQEYSTEHAAQSHWPSDTVVWLNTHSGVWHFKGERYYGNTKHRAFVC